MLPALMGGQPAWDLSRAAKSVLRRVVALVSRFIVRYSHQRW